MRIIDADAIELKARMGIEEDGLLFIPYADVKKSIDNTPTISQWIPVSERLPEENQKVLFAHIHGRDDVICGRYADKTFIVDGTWYTTYEVLAWMPLPEPYKKGDNNE